MITTIDILLCIALAYICCLMFLFWQERRGWRGWVLGLVFIGGGLSLLFTSIYILCTHSLTSRWDPDLRDAALGWFAHVPFMTWFFTGLAGLTLCAGRLHAIFIRRPKTEAKSKPEMA